MPLLWISLCFLIGLYLGAVWPWMGWPVLGLLSAVSALLLPRLVGPTRSPAALAWAVQVEPRLQVAPLVLLASLTFGAWRVGLAQRVAPDSPAALLNDRGAFRLRGVVIEPPDRREESTLVRLRLEAAVPLDEDGRPGAPVAVRGLVLAFMPAQAPWRYGDRLELDGRPETPPDASENADFSYREILARQGIASLIRYPRARRVEQGADSPLLGAVYGLREQAYRRLYRLFPAPEAPLLAGILLGIDSGLPPDLAMAFQDTGTAHIIAISGFNIAILAALFSLVFTALLRPFLSRWWALALTVLAVAGYTLLAGAGASVVRAAIMGCLGLLAAQIGRSSAGPAGFNTLTFTAAVMCLFNPLLPWDASFQLSFAATLGLMLYAAHLQAGFTRLAARWLPLPLARRLAGPVGEYILFTLAAQVTTLPVILYHFRRLSLSALLVNPLVLPAQPLVMILGGLAVLTGLIYEPLGHLLGWLALPLTTYTIRVIEAFAALPGGAVTLPRLSPAAAGLLFAAVTLPAFAAEISGKISTWARRVVTPVTILVVSGLLAAFLARAALAAPDGRLRLTIFEGGGHPILLVQAPDGSRMLVNSGASANRLSADLDRRFSPLDRRVDALVIADCAPQALESLSSLVERFPIHSVWWACEPGESRTAQNGLDAVTAAKIESRDLEPGARLLLGEEVTVEVLETGEETSALRVEWQNFRALFTGGPPPAGLGESTVGLGLLVIAPESLRASDPDAWEQLGAQAVVVIPPHGPGASLPNRWLRLLPWDWARVTTDGERMWVELK